nr:MAG TPA: hypothetical protein [Caudoviricetes sp.]DAX07993.1 MAG TPA: hypothetical protein [Bacteriophage sp.]
MAHSHFWLCLTFHLFWDYYVRSDCIFILY